jgi:cytochrome P450
MELESTSSGFVIAGSETSATLLTLVTWYLLRNPTHLKNLTKEIHTTFNSDSEITMLSVNNLPYELAILEETLRLFPPGTGALPRTTLPDGPGATVVGQYIPPGTVLGVSHYAAFRSPLNFRDPDSFVPERWLGEPRYDGDNRAVFHPFSFGPRNCIGQKYVF